MKPKALIGSRPLEIYCNSSSVANPGLPGIPCSESAGTALVGKAKNGVLADLEALANNQSGVLQQIEVFMVYLGSPEAALRPTGRPPGRGKAGGFAGHGAIWALRGQLRGGGAGRGRRCGGRGASEAPLGVRGGGWERFWRVGGVAEGVVGAPGGGQKRRGEKRTRLYKIYDSKILPDRISHRHVGCK